MKKEGPSRQRRLARIFRASLFFILPSSCLTFNSCTRENICNTPFGEGAIINIYQPDFNALTIPGGTVTINRGYKGIFIHRTTLSDFVAFECACPNDNDVRLVLDTTREWGSDFLYCSTCKSRYDIYFGQPQEGAISGCPLYEYNTHFDGYTLEIYN